MINNHGTEYRRDPLTWNMLDDDIADLRLVSNLELLQYGDTLHWLPNPIDHHRMRQYRRPVHDGTLRIGHSPTRRDFKGTDVFLRAVERCQSMGLAVEPVLITDVSLLESLTIKGTCDVFFDSFWLGIQCSGLEAAAMGIPVIAGDHDVRREYEQLCGEVPYTFADTETDLVSVIERMVIDETFRKRAQDAIWHYVTTYHGYAEVARRYLDLLDEHCAWRRGLQLGQRLPMRRQRVMT